MIKWISSITTYNINIAKKIKHNGASNNTYSLIDKDWAPVAQLDRALGYGPGGSGVNS